MDCKNRNMKTAEEWFNEKYQPLQRMFIMEEMHMNNGKLFFELMDEYADYVLKNKL